MIVLMLLQIDPRALRPTATLPRTDPAGAAPCTALVLVAGEGARVRDIVERSAEFDRRIDVVVQQRLRLPGPTSREKKTFNVGGSGGRGGLLHLAVGQCVAETYTFFARGKSDMPRLVRRVRGRTSAGRTTSSSLTRFAWVRNLASQAPA